MAGEDYATSSGSGSRSVFWSAISVAGRQGLLLAFSLLLARILGPDAYGVIAQAAIFISLSTLLMDQGITAALINSRSVARTQVGAASGLNITLGALLSVAAVAAASPLADFFKTPELAGVLVILGIGLMLKAIAVVPRMMLVRAFDFKSQAILDVAATLTGGMVGVVSALTGGDYWALVLQILVTDALTALLLTIHARPPLPNFRFKTLWSTMGFSSRVLFSNLVSYTVQNLDSILIARTMSTQSVAHYSLAYRVLTTPTLLVGQVVTRVLFPAMSRLLHTGGDAAALIAKSTQTISLLTFPGMALIAVSAPITVPLVVGEAWLPVVPLLLVFAVGGARASVTTVNTSVVMGLGRADIMLRFSMLAAVTQIAGIIVGLRWGILGVAIGFTAAGFALTPVICAIQKRIAGFNYRAQLASVLPAFHATIWLIGAYLLIQSIAGTSVLAVVAAFIGSVAVFAVTIRVFHKSTWLSALYNARRVLGR
jgi:O-antigen/teichoic acid export membrane protein